MPEEPLNKEHWMYKLACTPCDKLKEKVEFKGLEIKPLLSLAGILMAIFLFLRKDEK